MGRDAFRRATDGIYVARVDGTAVRLVVDAPARPLRAGRRLRIDRVQPDLHVHRGQPVPGVERMHWRSSPRRSARRSRSFTRTSVRRPNDPVHEGDGADRVVDRARHGGSRPSCFGSMPSTTTLPSARTPGWHDRVSPDELRRRRYDRARDRVGAYGFVDREGRDRRRVAPRSGSVESDRPGCLVADVRPPTDPGSRTSRSYSGACPSPLPSGVFVVDLATGDRHRIGEGTRPAWVDDHTLIVEKVPRRGGGK